MMKHSILPVFILLLLLNTSNLLGQTKLTYGVNFFPNFSDHHYFENESVPWIDLYKRNQIPRLSYSLGFSLGIEFGEKFVLQTGLNWVNTGGRSKKDEGVTDTSDKPLPDARYTILRKRAIELPVEVLYHFAQKSNRQWYIQLGSSIWRDVSNQFLMYDFFYDRPDPKETNDITQLAMLNFRPWNLTGSFGLGCRYQYEKMDFFIGPKLQYSFLYLYEGSYRIGTKIFNFGLATGLRF